jgi:hypothetical protein
MLWVHGLGTTAPSWFTVLTEVPRLSVARAQGAQWALRGIMAGMLIGHGAFGLLMGKPNLLGFYDAAGLGIFGVPLPTLSAALGGFEMVLGVLCVEAPWSAFFLFVGAWKLGTEFLHVPAQAYGAWWEVLERGGAMRPPCCGLGFSRCSRPTGSPRWGSSPAASGPREAAWHVTMRPPWLWGAHQPGP